MEDLIYRRLLDVCYDTEKPLPKNIEKIAKLIGLKNNLTETQAVIEEYFKLTKSGYIQKRVQKELSKYKGKAEAARANGKLGGRPKKTQSVNSANPVETKQKANQEPRTKNHKPIKDNGEFDLVWSMYGKKGNKKTSLSKFSRMKDSDKKLMSEHLPKYIKSKPDKQYRKNLETYINQECWNDEIEDFNNEQTASNIRHYETPTDRARRAGEELRRQQQAYTENDLLLPVDG